MKLQKDDVVYRPLNKENGTEIESLGDYLQFISEISKSTEDAQLFFRGQEVEFWQIEPSIFRDDMLSVEHLLMSEPIRRIPSAFKPLADEFEIMEKYQHYGMCTRLLDLTTNPLVALYFACKLHGKEDYRNENGEREKQLPYGVVYYKEERKPALSTDYRIKIILALAKMDLTDMKIGTLLFDLLKKDSITIEQYNKWKTKEGIQEFIKIVQGVYTVLPVLSNERLIRQSGAFLIPGKFSFSININDIEHGTIYKSKCNLKEEFNPKFVYVHESNKQRILNELDACDINQPYLFPELEYQLQYIKEVNASKTALVSYFEKFNEVYKKEDEIEYSQGFKKNEMREALKRILSDNKLIDEIIEIFVNNEQVDWIKRNSVISRIRIELNKLIKQYNYSQSEEKQLLNEIMDIFLSLHLKEKH